MTCKACGKSGVRDYCAECQTIPLPFQKGIKPVCRTSRWPDTGRFRSTLQAVSWLWFFEHHGMQRGWAKTSIAARRELH